MGQIFDVNYNVAKYEIEQVLAKRHKAEAHEIRNAGAKAWGVFQRILNNEDLDIDKKAELLNRNLSRLAFLCEPETVAKVKLKTFKPFFSEETRKWMRRLKYLENENNRKYVGLEKYDLVRVRRHFNKLVNIDRLSIMAGRATAGNINELEFFKIHDKINKNTTRMNDCKFTVTEIADGFAKLQWDGAEPKKSDFKWANKNNCTKKYDEKNLFKLKPVSWEGNDKSESLRCALMSCKKSSRGMSGYSRRFLESLPAEFRSLMLELVNSSLTLGKYYKFWRYNRVTPIPKKGDLKNFKNWRPISVADCLASCVEKIATAQFLNFLETKNEIFKGQHGFRKLVGCGTAIAEVINHVKFQELMGNKIGALILIDAKNAFGNLDHQMILDKLFEVCDDITFNWFEEFLTRREFLVNKNSIISEKKPLPDKGVPQGSGPGPVLFNFGYNGVFEELAKMCFVVGYADDIILAVHGVHESEVKAKLEDCVEHCRKAMAKRGIPIAPNKTVVLKTGKWKTDTKIMLDDIILKEEDYVTYLGSRFDGQLSIDKQIEHVDKKMKIAAQKSFGLNGYGTAKMQCQMYHSLVTGSFQHSLDCSRILSDEIYRKFQKEIIIHLKNKLGLAYFQTKKNISDVEVLKLCGFRSLENTHRYLLMSRLNKIFYSQKPAALANELNKALKPVYNHEVIIPHGVNFGKNGETPYELRKKYYSLCAKNQYDVNIKIPQEYINLNYDSSKIREIWPYFIMEEFNSLPVEIRRQFGTYNFKNEIKSFYTNGCQHRRALGLRCKYCKTEPISVRASILYNKKLKELKNSNYLDEILGKEKIYQVPKYTEKIRAISNDLCVLEYHRKHKKLPSEVVNLMYKMELAEFETYLESSLKLRP